MFLSKSIVFLLMTAAVLVHETRATSSDPKVTFVAILYRHGDRTPVDPYPTDPWRNESYWPVKFGQLTNQGKQQHYALGKWLKTRYSHLLSEKYDPTEIYIRSTDVDRTLMSAQANLAGMYPPEEKQVWNTQIHWQPIPIHTIPEDMDHLLAMKKKCPAYAFEMHKFKHSEEFRKMNSSFTSIYKYLTAHTGKKINSFQNAEYIYNNLYIETLYNFSLPEWTRNVYPDKLLPAADLSFRIPTYNKILARLKVGPLVKEINEYFQDAKTTSVKNMKPTYNDVKTTQNQMDPTYDRMEPTYNNRKVVVFSAHDDTVAAVLNSLGLYDGHCPSYTATILFELLKDKEEYYVRILYRNSTEIVEPHVMSIPSCGNLCPYEKFVSLYDNLISVNWEEECNMSLPGHALMLFGVTVLFVLIVISMVKVLSVLLQPRNNTIVKVEPSEWDNFLSHHEHVVKLYSNMGTKNDIMEPY